MKCQKIHKKSAPPYDEEKAETDSKNSIKKFSRSGHQYIATSPDGTQVVTLNTKTYQLKLCNSNDLSEFYEIRCADFKNVNEPSEKVNWSLSVSNKFILADGTYDALIAVSCFDDNDMRYKSCSDE